jgi:hypothetical protein
MGTGDERQDKAEQMEDQARRRMGREREQRPERGRQDDESPERGRPDEDTLEQQWSQGEDPF